MNRGNHSHFLVKIYCYLKQLNFIIKIRKELIFKCAFYAILHIILCNKTMEEILKNLSEAINEEIRRMDCSYTYFADICGIHRNELSSIIGIKRKDISLSVIVKICQNTEIEYSKIFGYSDDYENALEKTIIFIGKKSYILVKK